ncbi:hypothetical protein NVP1047O_03 [Vibrio phage 1.047.O._10N.286.55.F2]|nr:hypothetical protein NVP1047O_03 [Vibrio phage 1.047.O._10N.286.55.F2]
MDNSILSRFKRFDDLGGAMSSGSSRVIIYSPESRVLNYHLNRTAAFLDELGVGFSISRSNATIRTESIQIIFSSDTEKLRGYEIGTPIVLF